MIQTPVICDGSSRIQRFFIVNSLNVQENRNAFPLTLVIKRWAEDNMFRLLPTWHINTSYVSYKKVSHAQTVTCWNLQVLFPAPSLLGLHIFSGLHSELNRKAKSVKDHRAKIELLGSYDPQKQLIIKDPYYVSIPENSYVWYFIAYERLFFCFIWSVSIYWEYIW